MIATTKGRKEECKVDCDGGEDERHEIEGNREGDARPSSYSSYGLGFRNLGKGVGLDSNTLISFVVKNMLMKIIPKKMIILLSQKFTIIYVKYLNLSQRVFFNKLLIGIERIVKNCSATLYSNQ